MRPSLTDHAKNLTGKAAEIAGKTQLVAKDIANKAEEKVRRLTHEKLQDLRGVKDGRAEPVATTGTALENIKDLGSIYIATGKAKAKDIQGKAKDVAAAARDAYKGKSNAQQVVDSSKVMNGVNATEAVAREALKGVDPMSVGIPLKAVSKTLSVTKPVEKAPSGSQPKKT